MESSKSKKFTLFYASLIGAGVVTRYLQGRSKISLVAGGGSAALFLLILKSKNFSKERT